MSVYVICNQRYNKVIKIDIAHTLKGTAAITDIYEDFPHIVDVTENLDHNMFAFKI